MNKSFFDKEVEAALEVLRNGGIILYPTDTVWGIGCDATNEDAIKKIYDLKKRADNKSMIVLVADERDILQYVAAPDLAAFDYIGQQQRPTTVIFENAVALPQNLVAADGSIAIRIVQDEFCRHLVKRLRKPIVSTSANISGNAAPKIYKEIDDEIKEGVDYMVKWRQEDETPSQPSQIVKWNSDGSVTVIRS